MLDRNSYYNRIHLIFLEQNPSINSFDLYRPAWEFLKDSAKFQSITMALKAAPQGKKHMTDELVDLMEQHVVNIQLVHKLFIQVPKCMTRVPSEGDPSASH